MLVLDIQGVTVSSGRFVAMMFDKAGMIDDLPSDNLETYDYIRVVVKGNSIECILSKDRDLYQVHWDSVKNAFSAYKITGMNRLPVSGRFLDVQCDVLYELFSNNKELMLGNKRIFMKVSTDENGDSYLEPVFENCTLESFVTELKLNKRVKIQDNKELALLMARLRARFIISEAEMVTANACRVSGIVPQYMRINRGDALALYSGDELIEVTVIRMYIDDEQQDTVYSGDYASLVIRGDVKGTRANDFLMLLK